MSFSYRVIDDHVESCSYQVIDGRVERRKDGELVRVSEEEGKVIDAAVAHAHADGARGDDRKFRVIEYYIDCGTRANGWNIGSEGASRAEWERFKRESPFYKRCKCSSQSYV